MIRNYSPPITVNESAIHSIDSKSSKISIVFYISSLTDAKSMSKEEQDELKTELECRLKNIIKYLFKEGFIDSTTQKWDATAGVIFGKIQT